MHPVLNSQTGPDGGVSVETGGWSSTVGDWIELLKPRVIQLVVFTGAIGLLMAPGSVNPIIGGVAVICIAVAAGAAGSINMWYDSDIDRLMRRTVLRPIPSGRISPGAGLSFGLILAIGSVLLMFLATNLLSASILALSMGFYILVYTIWLKRRTPQNIVFGGAAGAFPPVIGWSAVTGTVDMFPLIMFAIIFLWTPPHFWSLSLYAHDDYARAGVPMLPVTKGARVTRMYILSYTLALSSVSLAPWVFGFSGLFYGFAAILLGAIFICYGYAVLSENQDIWGRSLENDVAARSAFRFSLIYLFLLFAALAIDHWL